MIIDFIWSVCRVIAFLLQFIGVAGILMGFFILMLHITDIIERYSE